MDAAALAEKWREVVESPYLRDLPFKLELNEDGKVEFAMSPATNWHSHRRLKSTFGIAVDPLELDR